MADPAVCCMHFGAAVDDAKTIKFSLKSWSKTNECIKRWINIGGYEKIISENILNLPIDENTNLPSQKHGYCSKCYCKFTDIGRISAAEKKLAKGSPISLNCGIDGQLDTKRTLHSNVEFSCINTSKPDVLPAKCILCKSQKYIKDRISGKRNIEKLSLCVTKENILLRAAHQKNDEALLIQIRDKDLVAIEVRYHRSCFRNYTRFLTKSVKLKASSYMSYEKSYKVFCASIIESRIIELREVLRMSQVTESFIKIVQELEDPGLTEYKNADLKRKIKKDYPQVEFVKQALYNRCELVLCESGLNQVADSKSSSETETDEDFVDVSDQITAPSSLNKVTSPNVLRDLYTAAKALRSSISERVPKSFPPTSPDIASECVFDVIPVELFNFLAWCVGASEEASIEDFVDVSDSVIGNIASIAQDIVSVSNTKIKCESI